MIITKIYFINIFKTKFIQVYLDTEEVVKLKGQHGCWVRLTRTRGRRTLAHFTATRTDKKLFMNCEILELLPSMTVFGTLVLFAAL